jgi:hypothetical protein
MLLTLAAVLFVGLALWAAGEHTLKSDEATLDAAVPN